MLVKEGTVVQAMEVHYVKKQLSIDSYNNFPNNPMITSTTS